ncbi:MAG: 1-acyl-sn-glycerol-3-phosphate acyltransferase [Clostridia bacterium]|nr:1-acyl-sn-glycerol-3-phosphate acyltransferase [Clostridia bacterium]
MTKMYRFFQILFLPLYKLFFRLEVKGLENEMKEGACIICANHISMHDIFFIGTHLKRQIYFFAKKELFKNPILGKILRSFGTISVNRGAGDLKAIKSTIEVLEKGCYVGLFPQGTRIPDKEPSVEDAKGGVGLFAYRSKCSILPIHIKTKNYRVRLFRKVTVTIGKPIPYEELGFEKGNMAEYNAASRYIFERICELGKEEQN